MCSDDCRHRRIAVALLLVLVQPARAQVPFYTDDTGVTDLGTLHFELSDEYDALQSMQYPDLRQNTANIKVNVGLPWGLEFDVDAPYLTIERTAGASDSAGIGDTNTGLKWQIRQAAPGSRMPSLAASFYVEFPTGDYHNELGSGERDYWLNSIAQWPVSEQTRVNINLGILFAGNTSTGVVGIETRHGHVYTGGLSVLHDFNERWTLGAELYGGFADSSGLDRDQLQGMLGASYTIRDGLSVYCGLISGTFTASPKIGGQIGVAIDFPHMFGSSSHSAARRSPQNLAGGRPQFHLPTAGDFDDL